MAGVDKRPAQFRTTAESKDFPEGLHSLETPPECGRDPTGDRFQSAWHKQIADKFIGQEQRERYRDQQEALIGIAADELEYLAKDCGRTFYYIFEMPAESDERRKWMTVVKTLKEQYPAIALIELRVDAELERDELRLLRPLRDLLHRS